MSKGLLIFAEDDPQVRLAYTNALKANGFSVFATSNGQEVLDMLPRVKPRVLVLDVDMPEVDGIEACKRARNLMDDSVPILFLSDMKTLDALHECMEAGGDDFLLKTDNMETILARINFWASYAGRSEPWRKRKNADTLKKTRKLHLGIMTDEPEADDEVIFGAPADVEDVLSRLRKLIASARSIASMDYGKTREEKVFLLGYIFGALEEHSGESYRLKVSFRENLLALLRGMGALDDQNFVNVLSQWHQVAAEERFLEGVDAGRADSKASKTEKKFRPLGLAFGVAT